MFISTFISSAFVSIYKSTTLPLIWTLFFKSSLSFSIKSRYAYTKNNNTILLEVVKENQTYKARTNILFAKEGDNGTNGTDYVC